MPRPILPRPRRWSCHTPAAPRSLFVPSRPAPPADCPALSPNASSYCHTTTRPIRPLPIPPRPAPLRPARVPFCPVPLVACLAPPHPVMTLFAAQTRGARSGTTSGVTTQRKTATVAAHRRDNRIPSARDANAEAPNARHGIVTISAVRYLLEAGSWLRAFI